MIVKNNSAFICSMSFIENLFFTKYYRLNEIELMLAANKEYNFKSHAKYRENVTYKKKKIKNRYLHFYTSRI